MIKTGEFQLALLRDPVFVKQTIEPEELLVLSTTNVSNGLQHDVQTPKKSFSDRDPASFNDVLLYNDITSLAITLLGAALLTATSTDAASLHVVTKNNV